MFGERRLETGQDGGLPLQVYNSAPDPFDQEACHE